jgi:hypothetical protein
MQATPGPKCKCRGPCMPTSVANPPPLSHVRHLPSMATPYQHTGTPLFHTF